MPRALEGTTAWRFPIYPAAYPATFVTLLWSTAELHPATLIRPLVVGVAAAVLISVVMRVVIPDRNRSAFLSALVVVGLIANDDWVTWGVLLLGAVVLGELLIRRGKPWRFGPSVTRVMNVLSFVLLLALTIKVVQDGVILRAVDDVTGRSERTIGQVDDGAPDIYLLVLDAFPGERATEDGSPATAEFADALASRGFAIQADSHSNYAFTGLTLTSLFSMQHIDDITALAPPHLGPASDSRRLRGVMRTASAFDMLAERGYDLMNITSGFDHVDLRGLDRQIDLPQPGEFEIILLRATRLGDIIERVAPNAVSQVQRDRIHDGYRLAREVASDDSDGPRFAFIHLPAPHAPWVFAANGEPRQHGLDAFYSDDPGELGIDSEEAVARSQEMARYTSRLTLEFVDHVISSSRRPPVIIVMSDHGTGIGMDADDYRRTDLVERFSNFMAVRAPGRPDILDDRLSPVNVFPRLLNAYFGSQIPEQEDAVYAWGSGILDTVRVHPVEAWDP